MTDEAVEKAADPVDELDDSELGESGFVWNWPCCFFEGNLEFCDEWGRP